MLKKINFLQKNVVNQTMALQKLRWHGIVGFDATLRVKFVRFFLFTKIVCEDQIVNKFSACSQLI